MKEERGAVMVEAVLVFPIVLFTVFLMIYLGLFKLQELAFMYQVQRVAHQGAMVVASPGYETLGNYWGKNVDFTSGTNDVKGYCEAFHKDLKVLYRELTGCGGWTNDDELQSFDDRIKRDNMVLAGISTFVDTVEIDRGFLSHTITAEVSFGLPTPGVMRYLGFGPHLRFRQGAYCVALNPSTVVRVTDLASDLLVVVGKKLNIDKQVSKVFESMKNTIF